MWIAFLLLTLAGWGAVFFVLSKNARELKCAPRRPVPWNALDAILLFFLYGALPVLCFDVIDDHDLFLWTHEVENVEEVVGEADAETDPEELAAKEDAGKETPPTDEARAHSALRVLASLAGGPGVFILLFVVVIVAPIQEEFLYRLVLQGCIEKYERLLRHPFHVGRFGARGLISITISSAFFAAAHIRNPEETIDVARVFQMIAALSIAFPVVMAASVGWLALRGSTLKDLGVQPKMFTRDVMTGLSTFLLILLPIYGLQLGLSKVFPDLVIDSFTLFPFALVLGFLYFRTHRIVASITLHMALNATSVALMILR